MHYIFPQYIADQGQPSPVLKYIWDDTRVDMDFQYNPTDLIGKIMGTTTRSKIALCIGIYEWIIWRFHRLSDDPAPFQIAEASWCGNINAAYVEYIEFSRKEYCGPVRRPLFAAMMSLGPVLNFTSVNESDWVNRLFILAPLAMHVLPDTKPFESWLETVTDRLLLIYPASEDDPYEDMFNEQEEERRGPLVAREALDPSFDYRPEQAPMLLDQFLRGVDYENNPFLRGPKEMLAKGFKGEPYKL